MASARCVYCGGLISTEGREEATIASRKISRSKSLVNLEALVRGPDPGRMPRRYLVLDTAAAPPEIIAEACVVSLWEARQWRASSRYRLMRVTAEPPDSPLEAALKAKGIEIIAVPAETVERLRTPVLVESIDSGGEQIDCALLDEEDGPSERRGVRDADVGLIVSGAIRRDKVKEQDSRKPRKDARMEDVFLVHLHVSSESRPWELDARRTRFEGPGLLSAYLQMVALMRRVARAVPHDDGFKNMVPALSPSTDPGIDLGGLEVRPASTGKESRVVIFDNAAQFREYSAWRGAVEAQVRGRARAGV